MVCCGREPCQSKRAYLGTEKLSTCFIALWHRRPKQLYRLIYLFFFQNGDKMCLAGLPHIPLIAPLHPFSLVFSNYSIFVKCTETALFPLK